MGSAGPSTDLRLFVILVGLSLLVFVMAPPIFSLFGNERFLDEALVPGLRWRAELRTEPEGAYDDTYNNSDDVDKDQSAGYSPDDDEPAAFNGEVGTRKRRPPTASRAPMAWEQLLLGEASATSRRALSHFQFQFHQPVPDDVRHAFQFAGQVVSAHFEEMQVPVRVAVDWVPLEREVLAHAGPTAFYKVASPSGQQHEAMVWLPKALMNQRVRYPPPDYKQPDMVLTVNSLGAWHSGLKGNVPHGHYDLVTVVIHELQHGLGFLSMVGQGNSLNGIESFSKGVQGEAYIFDRFVHVVGQGHIFSAPSVAQNRGLINTTISLVWESPSFTEENKPKLYVPTTFEGSSSISHLDEAAYPPGAPSSLMTPVLAKQEVIHNLGGLLIKMYEDMGWHMRDCTRYRSCGSCVSNLCRWCYDPITSEGECGDPGAYPFFNAECLRPNSTDVLDDDYCRLDDEADTEQWRESPAAAAAQAAAAVPPSIGEKRPNAGASEGEEGVEGRTAGGPQHRTQDDQVLVDQAARAAGQAAGESSLDVVVVAKATNECWDVLDCVFVRQHSATTLKAIGLALFLMIAVVLTIYL